MRKDSLHIDSVRASRDGHEYHETWAARMSLRLVLGLDELSGISMEGLSPADSSTASGEAVAIADLTFYYGKGLAFAKCRKVVITQAKYSISKKTIPFRASEAAKTVSKFAKAYRDFRKEHGSKATASKLEFELVTNRPVSKEFIGAVKGLLADRRLKGKEAQQAKQFKLSCKLTGKQLIEFARKFSITGSTGSLRENKDTLSRIVADWSGGQDTMASLRLADLKTLVRDKAGSAGQGRNMITRVDVLGALRLQLETDLLPFPVRFPEVGPVVPRAQLAETVKLIRQLKNPLLIHADGGIGKTVFLQSLANSLSAENKCVLFDCFGGGIYRTPEDGRHRPERGLIQIVNSLACAGLCDPLLPANENVETLISTFRRRLEQCVLTLRKSRTGKLLIIFIDAIDNAARQANDKKQECFPKLLLQSLEIAGAIEGVKFVMSCRTHRRALATGGASCEQIKLEPFNKTETEKFLRDRVPKISDSEILVAKSRSDGNPRILEHLANERGLLEPSEVNRPITINALLKERINAALAVAISRGSKKHEIDSFLAGLTVLPPPIPVAEYADAHGLDKNAVESFASDLAPLLERTRHGLTFRDEPTETYIHEHYAADAKTLRKLAHNLLAKQDVSVYAANALPGLLDILDDGKQLFALAFNDEFPATITSSIGKQRIRYFRIKAAVIHAARKRRYDHLVRLLVELSTVAAVNERGVDYLVANPELAVLSQDAEAVRRLVEDRSHWAGTKHARVAIAMALSQDPNEALRHAIRANDWFQQFYASDEKARRERSGPGALDVASISLCLVGVGRNKDAAGFIGRYFPWFSFGAAKKLFRLLAVGQSLGAIKAEGYFSFLMALTPNIGVLAGALSFVEFDIGWTKTLLRKLATACKKRGSPEKIHTDYQPSREYRLQDGLLKSACLAIYRGLYKEAEMIANAVPTESTHVYVFLDDHGIRDVFPFVARIVVASVARREALSFHDLLPTELTKAGAQVPKGLSLASFRAALKAEFEKQMELDAKLPKEKRDLNYHRKNETIRFIDDRFELLHKIASAFVETLTPNAAKRKVAVQELLKIWEQLRLKPNHYSGPGELDLPLGNLGRQLLEFSFWTGSSLEKTEVSVLVEKLLADPRLRESSIIEIVSVLARHSHLHEIAGKVAATAKERIEAGDDATSRAELFAKLAKAILPASQAEAKSYFRSGLEQMDAIGSGDYHFTNELMGFAGTLDGHELEAPEFHIFTNLCELNLNSDEEKNAWLDLGRAMSRISGCRGIAKLARWNDRRKASLEYSLLPYLYALLEQDKMSPSVALGLLRLTSPTELYSCGTSDVAALFEKKQYSERQALLIELVKQFEDNHPNSAMAHSTHKLREVVERVLGAQSELGRRFVAKAPHFERVIDEQNERTNSRSSPMDKVAFAKRQAKEKREIQRILKKVFNGINTCDEAALAQALTAFAGSISAYDGKKQFLAKAREQTAFADRAKHVEAVAKLAEIEIYAKLEALKNCKREWADSESVKSVLNRLAGTLIEIHANDFIQHDYFSTSIFREVAELCSLDFRDLTLDMVRTFASPANDLPASIWLEFASIFCPRAKQGEGQRALTRLLQSGAAKLSSNVQDGAYKATLYPKGGEKEVAAGLTWVMLGSPSVLERWRAAHAIRCFAEFENWGVIDLLVRNYFSQSAGPFQAPELPFYFFHARLWFMIALHRLSMDQPDRISKYALLLQKVAADKKEPHLLLRHFAAGALLNCHAKGSLRLSSVTQKALTTVDKSPFKPEKVIKSKTGEFYGSRPSSTPEPANSFHLDYDFDKNEVESVSRMFNSSRWDIKDGITAWVRGYDGKVKSMYEARGRHSDYRERHMGINSTLQSYGAQLGWHGLHVVTGKLLLTTPLAIDEYDDEPRWNSWFGRQALSRRDGLWLSEGMDRTPLDTQVNLLETAIGIVTSKKEILLSLVRPGSVSPSDFVVCGTWKSPDEVAVRISSSFVRPSDAQRIATELAKQDGFRANLPFDDYDPRDRSGKEKKPKTFLFVTSPSQEPGIDERDPLGAGVAMWRPRFKNEINSWAKLHPSDAFERTWIDHRGQIVARSEAWGSSERDYEGSDNTGTRLTCTRDFLQKLLFHKKMDLLLLLVLRKYTRGYGGESGRYWHSTAVVRVTKGLKLTYYPGLANAEHKARY